MTRHLMTAALALALMSGTSALAQPQGDDRGGEHHEGGQGAPHGGAPQGAPRGGPPQGAPRPSEQPRASAPRPSEQRPSEQRPSAPVRESAPAARPVQTYPGGDRGERGGGYRGESAPRGQAGAPRSSGFAGRPAGGNAASAAPRNYHPRFGAPGVRPGAQRPQYNARYFPRTFQPDRRYQWRGGWSPQPGFYAHHWGYGDRLPFGWFAAQWYINDYYYYDLPVPPYGYEWVRVGPDALLVDLDGGEVVESVYGIFY